LRIQGNVTIEEPIISHGNQIAFEFYSDSEVTYKGFSAVYRGIYFLSISSDIEYNCISALTIWFY